MNFLWIIKFNVLYFVVLSKTWLLMSNTKDLSKPILRSSKFVLFVKLPVSLYLTIAVKKI